MWPQLLFWVLRLQLSAVAHICRQKPEKWNADQPVQRRFLKYRDYTAALCRFSHSAKVGFGHSSRLRFGCRQDGDDFSKAALLFFLALHKIKNHDHLFGNHEISAFAVVDQSSSLMSFLWLPEWIQPSRFPRHMSVSVPWHLGQNHTVMTRWQHLSWQRDEWKDKDNSR